MAYSCIPVVTLQDQALLARDRLSIGYVELTVHDNELAFLTQYLISCHTNDIFLIPSLNRVQIITEIDSSYCTIT